MILGIETSCDETAAAVVDRDGEIRSNVITSQAELHARYGGVVPEVASRRHLELDLAGDRRGARPGGSLARRDRRRRRHRRARADRGAARRARRGEGDRLGARPAAACRSTTCTATSPRSTCSPLDLEPPFTCLLASGGHTLLLDVRGRGWDEVSVLGTTRDDAAGEAFDKGARLLGLPYPGGAEIDRLAREGDPGRLLASRSRASPGLDFSFSGLKTALLYAVRDLGPGELARRRADLAASYQRAIVRALVERIEAAGGERLAIVGGVAANSELRAALPGAVAAPLALCTDNAAMIASAGRYTRTVPLARVPCARCVRVGGSELVLLLLLAAIAAAAWLTVRRSPTPAPPRRGPPPPAPGAASSGRPARRSRSATG